MASAKQVDAAIASLGSTGIPFMLTNVADHLGLKVAGNETLLKTRLEKAEGKAIQRVRRRTDKTVMWVGKVQFCGVVAWNSLTRGDRCPACSVKGSAMGATGVLYTHVNG